MIRLRATCALKGVHRPGKWRFSQQEFLYYIAGVRPSTAIVGVGQGAAVASNLLRNNVSTVLYDIKGDENVPEPLRQRLEGPCGRSLRGRPQRCRKW